ncbi:uncharacterized protein PpBr36_05745 [Pyricularia pennisetigena]|uniref:uncharacterized protein n=1 Tax=Pyricularia pennisetigena TaxID=1578925 RepID=UPI00115452CC|nr:uncharacterized protein PpBr36_05745 [Pyricularia pennisetigena]TLS23132.1 hypothetical protein PpBr36_05745 [Pyricularia pennisetigena]
MDGRLDGIEEAASGTFNWLLEHKTLKEWKLQRRGLLWIKGKPGSGKSTLMKYALRALPSVYEQNAFAFYFFFHGRGNELQKTPLGLFRSLLHQILNKVPGALCDLIKYFEDKQKTMGEPGEKWQWSLQPLQNFLKSALPKILERFPVILFIDALDECGENLAGDLIEYLRNLLESIPSTNFRLGVCFSCRHYPILTLDAGSTIKLEDENSADIRLYVQGRFSRYYPGADIERLISDRAQGESRGNIITEIKTTPEALDDLYRELTEDIKTIPDAIKLIQWICFSTGPLTKDELQWAMVIDPNSTCKSLDEYRGSNNFIVHDKMDRRITALSFGLTEVVTSSGRQFVQSVRIRSFNI